MHAGERVGGGGKERDQETEGEEREREGGIVNLGFGVCLDPGEKAA